jgi:hypothetical protein
MPARLHCSGSADERAFLRFDACGISLDPGPTGTDPIPWAPEQIRIMIACRDSVREVIDRRRTWDMMRRQWVPGR